MSMAVWSLRRILIKGYSVPRDFSLIENYKLDQAHVSVRVPYPNGGSVTPIQSVMFKPLRYCFEETIGFDEKASFARHPVSRLNEPVDIQKNFKKRPRDFSWIVNYKLRPLHCVTWEEISVCLYRLSDKLNTFHRNKTIHHADIITYFNCLFLKADK